MLRLNLDRWDALEKVYKKLCKSYPDPEVEEELEVSNNYAFREELLDRSQTSYDLVSTAISKRIGNLLEAEAEVMPAGGLTDAQKAAILVAKRTKMLANINRRVDKFVQEVAAIVPTVSSAIANSLEDELVTIDGLRTQLEDLTTAIREADPAAAEAARETHENQDREISERFEPAQEQLEAYARSCKELQVMADRD